MRETKWQVVANRIARDIASGRWREGRKLPSEEQLAKKHGVSLGTMQKALARLSHMGVLSREHGRGTFVAGARLLPADVRFLQFQDRRGKVLPLFVTVLKVARLKTEGVWSHFLGQRQCIRIDRLFEAGSRVKLFSEFFLRLEDYEALDESQRDRQDVGKLLESRTPHRAMSFDNLRQLFAQRLSLPTVKVEQLIRLSPPPARSAQVLGLDRETPGFVMELFGRSVNDRPLYYQRLAGGPFRESLVIVRDGNAQG